jgi:hypothetical protein
MGRGGTAAAFDVASRKGLRGRRFETRNGRYTPAFRQFKGQPFVKGRAGIGQIVEQRESDLGFGGQVFNLDLIMQRLADGAEAGQRKGGGKSGAEEKTTGDRKNQEREQERKRLIGDRVFNIHAHGAGQRPAAGHAQARRRETSRHPVPEAAGKAVAPVDGERGWANDEGELPARRRVRWGLIGLHISDFSQLLTRAL